MKESAPLIALAGDRDSDNSRRGGGNEAVAALVRARRLLYLSHLFAQFSEVSWQFALTLFLAAFADYQSLVLVSTYGLVSGLSVCLCSSSTGNFIDRTNRLVAAQAFIWAENVCVLLATAFCYVLLARQPLSGESTASQSHSSAWLEHWLPNVPLDTRSVLCIGGIHFFGSVAQVLDRGFLVAIERDWVVTLSRSLDSPETASTSKAWLSETNVCLKQIDLCCKVAAPAMAGFFIGAFDQARNTSNHYGNDLKGAALLVGLLNIAALVVEYQCTRRIYDLIPLLAVKEVRLDVAVVPGSGRELDSAGNQWRLLSSLRIYLHQAISPAGIALALLYLNVLTFGALMTAYLVWRGMRLETVGIWRGLSASVGLAGTFIYRISVKKLTVASTGMWSVCFQLVFVSLSFVGLFVDNFEWSMALIILGVCVSRVGLYVFDISVTQLMQEFIPDSVRGVVGGTQQSLNAFFMLLSFAFGIVFPDPRQFYLCVSAGYVALWVASFSYFVGIQSQAHQFLLSMESPTT